MTTVVDVVRARVGEVGPLAAEYRRDASRVGHLDDQPLPSGAMYWIARDGAGAPLAYAAGVLRPEGLVLGPFFVREAHRRKGVGRALLEAIQRWAAAAQVARLEVTVAADNAAGVSFLEAVGYRTRRLLMVRTTDGSSP